MKKILRYLNNKIIDVRMKNRLIEHTKNILKNKGIIKLYPNITMKDNNQKLIIKNKKNHIIYIYKKNHIIYIYKNNDYKEQYQIFKIKNEYISEYMNNNLKQISVFKKEKEMIKHIEQKEEETTYIRTHNNNILLIEKTKEYNKYYLGINENKYENYIQEHTVFTEIEKQDYINLISKKIKEEKILKKYSIEERKLHLH